MMPLESREVHPWEATVDAGDLRALLALTLFSIESPTAPILLDGQSYDIYDP